jgi:hypothetical protein
MTVTELIKVLTKYKNEIGCDGKSTSSHPNASEVKFYLVEEDCEIDLNLSEIELELRPGCRCPTGINFKLIYENR